MVMRLRACLHPQQYQSTRPRRRLVAERPNEERKAVAGLEAEVTTVLSGVVTSWARASLVTKSAKPCGSPDEVLGWRRRRPNCLKRALLL
jgi:hypothetical protein